MDPERPETFELLLFTDSFELFDFFELLLFAEVFELFDLADPDTEWTFFEESFVVPSSSPSDGLTLELAMRDARRERDSGLGGVGSPNPETSSESELEELLADVELADFDSEFELELWAELDPLEEVERKSSSSSASS